MGDLCLRAGRRPREEARALRELKSIGAADIPSLPKPGTSLTALESTLHEGVRVLCERKASSVQAWLVLFVGTAGFLGVQVWKSGGAIRHSGFLPSVC